MENIWKKKKKSFEPTKIQLGTWEWRLFKTDSEAKQKRKEKLNEKISE